MAEVGIKHVCVEAQENSVTILGDETRTAVIIVSSSTLVVSNPANEKEAIPNDSSVINHQDSVADPHPNWFQILGEADTLLNENWVDQVEHEKWQVTAQRRDISPSGRYGFSVTFLHNDTPQRVSNLWIFWRDELAITLVSLSHQEIDYRWEESNAGWRSKILIRKLSDHNPIVRWNTRIPKPHNIPFHFRKAWIYHESLKDVVEACWNEPLYDVPIRKVHLKQLEEEMEQILKDQENDPSNSNLQQMEFDKAMEIEEAIKVSTTMAKEKARVSNEFEGE
ncbi:hypothetical protein IFM89_012945 [Coptis chinensis]|uniref:Uncharacterized protein n=1 Tax=Coptis chinensis TaxID=261450 RepID=A0A835IWG7_9MAGN|nr:hypothetical protein IFM89_012945 [Coptis chinensis]